MNALYQLDAVSFAYPGRKHSLKGITLRVLQGEHLALLGCNGAGKSTLLQMLAGLQFATDGSLAFDGQLLGEALLESDAGFRRQFRSRVGFLFQNSDVQLFCPSVREEVAFGPLQLFPREEALRRSDEMMETFGIAKLAESPPYALSGGEKKRVALASVLAMNPDVVLLDEPTANLDPRTCDFLFDVMIPFINDPAKTVITATHDLGVARLLSRNAAVLTPEHTVALHAPTDLVLQDEVLLRQVNLVSARWRPESA